MTVGAGSGRRQEPPVSKALGLSPHWQELPPKPKTGASVSASASPEAAAAEPPYVISDERLAQIRTYVEEDHPAHGIDTYHLAGAVYDLLSERDAAALPAVDAPPEPTT